MSKATLSRRVFLQTLGVTGAVVGGAALVIGCGKKGAESLTCTDVSSLNDAQKGMRSTLKYTDKSGVAGKNCDNCIQYVAAPATGKCGTCKLIKGPIHPKGYCVSWAKKG